MNERALTLDAVKFVLELAEKGMLPAEVACDVALAFYGYYRPLLPTAPEES